MNEVHSEQVLYLYIYAYILGAGETGGRTRGGHQKTPRPVHNPAARDRHVQPKRKSPTSRFGTALSERFTLAGLSDGRNQNSLLIVRFMSRPWNQWTNCSRLWTLRETESCG